MAIEKKAHISPLQQAVLGDLGTNYLEQGGKTGLKVWGMIQRQTVMVRLGIQTFDGIIKAFREYRQAYELKNTLLPIDSEEPEIKIQRDYNTSVINALNTAIHDMSFCKTIGAEEREELYTISVQFSKLDHARVVAALNSITSTNVEENGFSTYDDVVDLSFSVKDRAIFNEIELMYAKSMLSYAQLSIGRARYIP